MKIPLPARICVLLRHVTAMVRLGYQPRDTSLAVGAGCRVMPGVLAEKIHNAWVLCI